MKVIDTHQHFWKYAPDRQPWISEEMAAIRRDFLPEDLATVLNENGVEGCIAVQAEQTLEETHWLLSLAQEHAFIKGVVGWVNLCSDDVQAQLEQLKRHNLLKGFRHVLQAEDPSFMLQPKFVRGLKTLLQFGYTYDILVYPKHLDAVLELVRQIPGQPFVIDHLAKPCIEKGEIDEWKKKMEEIARHENVYCKVSGMVTEAAWKEWNSKQLKPYLDTVVSCFGTERLLFGSDWPVCLVAASYSKWLHTVTDYFAPFSETEKENVFYRNAQKFYGI